MAIKRKKKAYKSGSTFQVATLCLSTAMALILLGLVVFTTLTARNLSSLVKENLIVTVMFNNNVTNREAQVVCKKLKQKHYVTSLAFTTREQALKEATTELGTDPSEFADMNPFTPSAELHLKADCANADSLAWIVKDVRQFKQVEEVSYQKDLMDSVNRNLRKIMLVLLVLAALLTFISFALINNMVRMGVYARRFIINTQKLVGASWGFIRWPFIRTAILEGLMAGIVADGVLAGIGYTLYKSEPDIVEVVTWVELAITGGAVLLFGLFISTVCVYFSVNYYLAMPARRLYRI